MKTIKEISPLMWLAIFILPLAIIIAAVPENTTKPYKIPIEDLVGEITQGAQYFTADQVADLIIQQDKSIQLIDVRPANDFETYHLPGAINIPLSDILSAEWVDYLDQDIKTNIFYSTGTVNANQAWIICTQRGFKNNYVLEGGLNHWAEVILNPQKPESIAPGDEIARYDFRQGASQALGGGAQMQATTDATESKGLPPVQKKEKKKKAAGGC
jgi:sulfur-carrier protein adenylyltransferase/sulfurtransferase